MNKLIALVSIVGIAFASLAGHNNKSAATTVTVAGPAVTTPVLNAGAVTLNVPAVAGNYSSAVLTISVVGDSDVPGSASGNPLFFDVIVANRSGSGGDFYLTNVTHVEGSTSWTYTHKTDIKVLQTGSITATFVVYSRGGEAITGTFIPSVTFTK